MRSVLLILIALLGLSASEATGLVVWIDPALETIAPVPGRLLQVLCRDQAQLPAIRARLADNDAALFWQGPDLPFADGLVAALVAPDAEHLADADILRILRPGGSARIGDRRLEKSWPENTDDWGQFSYDASGNAVSRDEQVGPPRGLRWQQPPRWARHHDHMASTSAVVSAGGRLFAIEDRGSRLSILLPARWSLVARDAFSGVELWRQPIERWFNHLWPNKSGPVQATRRLVARGDRLWVTLGVDAPVVELDAASGELRQQLPQSQRADELLLAGDTLLVRQRLATVDLTHATNGNLLAIEDAGRERTWQCAPSMLRAYDVSKGEQRWQQEITAIPTSLAMAADSVVYHDGQALVGLARADGSQRWRSQELAVNQRFGSSFAPTVVLADGRAFAAAGNERMLAVDLRNGATLWQSDHHRSGYSAPDDILIAGGLIWSGATVGTKSSKIFTGRNPADGSVAREFAPDDDTWHFHRCMRAKATKRYFMPGLTGIEMVDWQAEHWSVNHWVRGGCLFGILPANGLIYAPPHPCGCFVESKLTGFNALAPTSGLPELAAGEAADRLQPGPALASPWQDAAASWPMHRGNPARDGACDRRLPSRLQQQWASQLQAPITPAICTGNLVVTAESDHQQVVALDAISGETRWRYHTSGRIDSAPTWYRGRIYVGSNDGYITCLRAEDGVLAWRFRVAAADRRIVVNGQLESLQPVSGSVLVLNERVYAVAGRNAYLDGGLRFVCLDAASGELRHERIYDNLVPGSDSDLQSMVKKWHMPVALPDILAWDGEHLRMRSQLLTTDGERLDIERRPFDDQQAETRRLFSGSGFLDDAWFHRSYWIYGRQPSCGAAMAYFAGQHTAAGRILSVADDAVYGYGRQARYWYWAPVLDYHLFAMDPQPERLPFQFDRKLTGGQIQQVKLKRPAYRWSQELPFYVRGLLRAGGTLYAAGPRQVIPEVRAAEQLTDPLVQAQLQRQDAILAGNGEALLRVVNCQDGCRLDQIELPAAPVFDGLAASDDGLVISGVDGVLRRYQAR